MHVPVIIQSSLRQSSLLRWMCAGKGLSSPPSSALNITAPSSAYPVTKTRRPHFPHNKPVNVTQRRPLDVESSICNKREVLHNIWLSENIFLTYIPRPCNSCLLHQNVFLTNIPRPLHILSQQAGLQCTRLTESWTKPNLKLFFRIQWREKNPLSLIETGVVKMHKAKSLNTQTNCSERKKNNWGKLQRQCMDPKALRLLLYYTSNFQCQP